MATEAAPVPFREAIDFFRQKVNLPTQAWTDLWEGMHARAFVVAGAMAEGLVSDLRNAVAKAIEQGTGIDQFRRDFDQIVEHHGWKYNGGRNWRTRVIFSTNLRMAYAAGKWEQAQRLKDRRPYMLYSAVLDSRTRQKHAEWNGTVLPIDHPWWQTNYPPNGWGCRCTVRTLSERDLKRYGYKVSDKAPEIEWEERPVNTPSGEVTVKVPKGVDTGFGYSVGEAAWGRGAQTVALESHGPWTALEAPGSVMPADHLALTQAKHKLADQVTNGNEAGLRQSLRDALGADSIVVADPTGHRVLLGQAIADHIMADPDKRWGRQRYFLLMPGLIEDPAEIYVGFARSNVSGRVAMRRRYVDLIDLRGGRAIAVVADADGGMWSGMTFFHGDRRYLATLRSGLRIYRRP